MKKWLAVAMVVSGCAQSHVPQECLAEDAGAEDQCVPLRLCKYPTAEYCEGNVNLPYPCELCYYEEVC